MSEGPKYQKLAGIIRDNIEKGLYIDGHVLDTENELAKKYDMSRQTVRQALGLLESEGILERRRGSGTYVKQKTVSREKTMTVGLIMSYMTEYIYPTVVQGIEAELALNGYSMKLSFTANNVGNERNLLKSYLKNPVDGVIVETTMPSLPNPNLSIYQELSNMGIPYIFINGYYPQLHGAAYVILDSYTAGKKATEYLIKKGHKHIAGIFKADAINGMERYQAYLESLLEHKLTVRNERIFWYRKDNQDYIFEGTYKSKFLEAIEDCSAIVCYNDEIAVSIVELLKKAGRKVPEDISIISFDNSAYSDVCSVKLTSLNHPKEELGRVAARQLLNMINGRHGEQIKMPMEIIEKESIIKI